MRFNYRSHQAPENRGFTARSQGDISRAPGKGLTFLLRPLPRRQRPALFEQKGCLGPAWAPEPKHQREACLNCPPSTREQVATARVPREIALIPLCFGPRRVIHANDLTTFSQGDPEPTCSNSLRLRSHVYKMRVCVGWPQMPLPVQTQFARKLQSLGLLTSPSNPLSQQARSYSLQNRKL